MGLVVAQAEQQKNRNYIELLSSHHYTHFTCFTSIANETSGVLGPEAVDEDVDSKDLGHRLRMQTGDLLSYSYAHCAENCSDSATGQHGCGALHSQVPPH